MYEVMAVLTKLIARMPVPHNENKKGYCFKCLKPLRPDYTVFENYCLDC